MALIKAHHLRQPPVSAPGGLARRFWGTASADEMPATSPSEQSPPNHMTRPRTVRRAMASASVSSGGFDRLEAQRRRTRRHRLCRRQAALEGTFWATRPQMICPQRRCANNRRLMRWRVTELYGAQWRRRPRRCREHERLGGSSVGPCPVQISYPRMPIHLKEDPHSTVVLRDFGTSTVRFSNGRAHRK